jgi:putative ABC transport system permease protein
VPVLEERDPRFATDEAAWRAALDDPSLAFVSPFFLSDEAGPPQDRNDPGDQIAVVNSATREARPLTIAGIVSADFQFNGVLVSDELVEPFLGPLGAETRWYVAVAPGADPDTVAARLTGGLIANGVDAQSFRGLVDEQLSQQNGFFRLMQGFLGLGLVIGIAGLGVVMVRAVRERRRHIGMLRAMGFPSRVVRAAFLVEATFIAAQGILIGLVLGLLSSWSLLVNSSAFGDQRLDYEIPWVSLALVVAVPLGASLLAAAIPASRAAAIQPAVALRLAD